MLGGTPPFVEGGGKTVFDKIRECVYDYRAPIWATISPSAKDLIDRLLVLDPRERLAAADIPLHPWLKGVRQMPPECELPEPLRKRKVSPSMSLSASSVVMAPPASSPSPATRSSSTVSMVDAGSPPPAKIPSSGAMPSSTSSASTAAAALQPLSLTADAAASIAATAAPESRPICKYGVSCYRKNPEYFKEFRHPHLETH